MLTICRGEPKDYKQASEFMDEVIVDIDKFNDYFNTLRRDIYLLVDRKVHETMGLSRVEFFNKIKYKKINKELVNNFVNAALVESELDLIQGLVPLDVLLALKSKANKEDWEEIYLSAVGNREINISELKSKQKVRRSRHRARHIKRMSLTQEPTITSIMLEIRKYYKQNNKTKPTKTSTYKYWDEAIIINNISIDDDDYIVF